MRSFLMYACLIASASVLLASGQSIAPTFNRRCRSDSAAELSGLSPARRSGTDAAAHL